MMISRQRWYRANQGMWWGVWIGTMILVAFALLSPSPTRGMQPSSGFAIVDSQFYQRDPEDAGEVRVCIKNTGDQALLMSQLAIRVLAEKSVGSEIPKAECECVYAKLSPPLLRPGQYGEIVAKLMERPAEGRYLTCDVFDASGTISHTTSVAEPAMWISYVGFSEELRRIFVYVENMGQQPTEARLLRVGQFDVADGAKAIHTPVPTNGKGCLIADLPSPLTEGEFVHIVVAVPADGQESKTQIVARAIRDVPVVPEFGGGDPALGLDVGRAFLETMACPAHAHGTHKEAAASFLRDYVQRFSEDPSQVIQIAVCRSRMPGAWFRFGDLPDVAAVNTCLWPPLRYKKNPERWFSPFSCVGGLAKRATEPGRFVAIIPTGPDVEEGSFLLKGLTSSEWRFLVYCAMASGAKGVQYRGCPDNNMLARDAFRQLNRELQHLKPLLLIGEPVEWATTEGSAFVAKTLLCGDEAVLIMMFDCRYFSRRKRGKFYTPSFGRTVSPVRVNVMIPAGATVESVRTPFATLDQSAWTCRDDALALTAQMLDSAQVYIASLQVRQTVRWETGQPQ